MRRSDMNVVVFRDEGLVEVALNGEITLDKIASLDKQIRFILDANSDVIINFQNLDHIDSSSLGVLLTYYLKISKKNHFVFLGIKNEILNIFKVTGLLDRVPIYNSYDEALEALK